MMRVLICGSRDYTPDAMLPAVVRGLSDVFMDDVLVIIEGEAKGADTLAKEAAEQAGCEVDAYPADWKTHGRSAGPIRNKKMLTDGKPDLVVAFLNKPESESRGTANMIQQAQKAGIPVYVIERRLP